MKEDNSNYSQILDLSNLIIYQPGIDKICLCNKHPHEAKHQLQIN